MLKKKLESTAAVEGQSAAETQMEDDEEWNFLASMKSLKARAKDKNKFKG